MVAWWTNPQYADLKLVKLDQISHVDPNTSQIIGLSNIFVFANNLKDSYDDITWALMHRKSQATRLFFQQFL